METVTSAIATGRVDIAWQTGAWWLNAGQVAFSRGVWSEAVFEARAGPPLPNSRSRNSVRGGPTARITYKEPA